MSASAAAIVRTWKVGPWTATLTVPAPRKGELLSAVIEWDPSMPDRALTSAERTQYRAGRDAAIASLGLRTLVVDL